jgi:hypothetical protein
VYQGETLDLAEKKGEKNGEEAKIVAEKHSKLGIRARANDSRLPTIHG